MSTDPAKIQIEVSQTPSPPASLRSDASSLDKIKGLLEILAKLLPGLAFVLAVFLFRHEVSDFLQHASRVEAFGFKLEKGEFDIRLRASATDPTIEKNNPAWTNVPFRKLRLAAPLLKGSKILWVDDHPENNFYLRRILSDIGVEITIATNNREGLDAIKRKDFFLIISDFGRDPPLEENGGELALEAKRLAYEAPFVFFTSSPGRVSESIPKAVVTNDPSVLLSSISELSFARAH